MTGDNGLGKTFLLDIAWWVLTRTWARMPAMPPTPGLESSGRDGEKHLGDRLRVREVIGRVVRARERLQPGGTVLVMETRSPAGPGHRDLRAG